MIDPHAMMRQATACRAYQQAKLLGDRLAQAKERAAKAAARAAKLEAQHAQAVRYLTHFERGMVERGEPIPDYDALAARIRR
jgi:hypothetical protein